MSSSEGLSSLRDAMKHIHMVAGRFMNRGHAGFEYEEISDALGLALQELSLIRRCAEKAVEDPEGQEYAYRIRWEQEPFFSDRTEPHKCVRLCVTSDEALSQKRDFDAAGWKPVVERALLGTWERVDG